MAEAILLEIRNDIREMKKTNEKIQNDIEKINTKLSTQQQKMSNMDTIIVELDNKLKLHDKSLRSCNLILFKMQDTEEREKNTLSKVIEITNKVGITIPEVCFASSYRIGKYKQGNHRPILIRLIAPRWKIPFFEKLNEFNNLGYSIANDISKEEREVMRPLLRARYLLRNQGENAYIKGTNLYVNNKLSTKEEIETILEAEFIETQTAENFIKAPGTIKNKRGTRLTRGSISRSNSTSSINSIDKFVVTTPKTSKPKQRAE